LLNIHERKQAGRDNPSERFLSNTGGADVSIRTLGSRLLKQRCPRPRRQKISQAGGIGNSTIIIDAEAAIPETAFRGAPARLIAALIAHIDCDSSIHAG
jgi:hypothetical protein